MGWTGARWSCRAVEPGVRVFGADGLIYPCAEVAAHPRLAIGRFLPRLEMFESRCAAWRNWRASQYEKCRNCRYLLLCGGGCPLHGIQDDGLPGEPVCPPIESEVAMYFKGIRGQIRRLIGRG
jgi:radical SAM protein with 4Fe4S-binding SPASM domain